LDKDAENLQLQTFKTFFYEKTGKELTAQVQKKAGTDKREPGSDLANPCIDTFF
jgi:hypothetical protein